MSRKKKRKDSPVPQKSLAEIAKEKLRKKKKENKPRGWMTCGGETLKAVLSRQNN